MCGFAGQVNIEGLALDREQRLTHLRAMGQQLARRGPDDEQFYDDGYLSLVFRRLSIIDLEGGRQPLWNEDRSVLVVVNGEIYNHLDIRSQLKDRHRFSTQSDSEVIVHLYEDRGPRLMEALNGMFALLAWDTRKRHLLLARDRLGIKPLFYTIVGKTLFFASELKALLAHPDCPRDLDWWAFEGGSDDEYRLPTFIKGVNQLPGGHGLEWGCGKPSIPVPYWQLHDSFPVVSDAGAHKADDYILQYGDLLKDSVHKRLMSDVPVGLFLSGGLDSTLLAAMAADAQQELHCFTVVEDSTLEQGDVEQAKRATERLGLNYYPVRYDAKSVLNELDYDLAQFEFLIWAVETPRFDIEWLLKHELHRFAKTQLPDLKVILLGQGADEFAGGYSRSVKSTNPSWQAYTSGLARDQLETRRFQAGIPGHMMQALAAGYPPDRETGVLSEYQRQMLVRTGTLQRYNLWHEDRTSSCRGVEARVPFLDHRLVELLASVPPDLHESLFYNKRIVREQMARALPSYPPDKIKFGFVQSGKNTAINQLIIDLIRRVFPPFRAKYLEQAGAIFSNQRLGAYYQQVISGAEVSTRDLKDFCQCMAIEIFGSMCQEMPQQGPPKGVDPPSPLQIWNS